MTAEIAVGGTRLTVRVASCPIFEEPFPYQVCSPVSVDVFRIFVEALEGAYSVVTTENMKDLVYFPMNLVLRVSPLR
jgi:hypothetical protein